MKHPDIAGIPVLRKAHVTVNLEEVSLTFIILLVHMSGIERILGFGVLNRSHENLWRIGEVRYSVYCLLGCIKMFHIPHLMYVDLIINDDS